MNKLFEINDKTIYDIDTPVLTTSSFNYTNDAIYYINNNCVVITKNRTTTNYDIPEDLYALFHEEELKNKKDLTEFDELKLKILSCLNSNNKVFVFMNVLTYLDNDFKERLIRYLKLGNRRIINYTNEIEETLLLDYLVVIHEEEIIMEGKKEQVLKSEAKRS